MGLLFILVGIAPMYLNERREGRRERVREGERGRARERGGREGEGGRGKEDMS